MANFWCAWCAVRDARNRFNFALQVIDVDRIDTTFCGRVGQERGYQRCGGGRHPPPGAVHIFQAHPNVWSTQQPLAPAHPGGDLIHGFRVQRAEQLRGIPWMAPGMLSLHHLGTFKLGAAGR